MLLSLETKNYRRKGEREMSQNMITGDSAMLQLQNDLLSLSTFKSNERKISAEMKLLARIIFARFLEIADFAKDVVKNELEIKKLTKKAEAIMASINAD